MKRLVFLAGLLLISSVYAVSAWAADSSQNSITAPSAGDCVPDPVGVPFEGKVPKNFVAVPACPDAYDGTIYLFKGKAVVSGVISYAKNDTLGMYATLYIDDKSKPLLPELLDNFRLQLSALTTRFHLPATNDNSDKCYSAKVKVGVTEVGLVSDDTDAGGPFLKEFEVLSVDKVKSYKCPVEGE